MAWPDSQTREVELIVQSAQVDGSGTHNNFPVLLTRDNLPDEICSPTDPNRAQSNGEDIKAGTSSDMGTQLPIEIVKFEYDSSDGAGDADIEIWVKRDIATASNTSIWLGYNTAGTTNADAVTATYGRNNVWSEFQSVHHFEESSSSYADATGNGWTASDASGTSGEVSGAIGGRGDGSGAVDLDGSSTDRVEVSGLSETFDQDMTMQCWVRQPAIDTNQIVMALQRTTNTQYRYTQIGSGGSPTHQTATARGGTKSTDVGTSVTADTWQMVHSAFDNRTTIECFVDGASGGSTSFTTVPADSITRLYWQPGGYIEEARVAYSLFSSDWISTDYNNQSAPGTFVVDQTPQAVGGGGSTDALTADDISGGTPSLSSPVIGQEHALTHTVLSGGAPSLASPNIGQEHSLLSSLIDSGVPSLSSPSINQAQQLIVNPLNSDSPSLSSPAIGQTHVLDADNFTAGDPDLEMVSLDREASDGSYLKLTVGVGIGTSHLGNT